jgi:hypothetical protein
MIRSHIFVATIVSSGIQGNALQALRGRRLSILRKGSLHIHPGASNVIFHPPIDPAAFATREESMRAARSAIASSSPQWMTEPS